MPTLSATIGAGESSKTDLAAVKELFRLNVEFEVRRRLGREDPLVTNNIIIFANREAAEHPNKPFPGWDGLWREYWTSLV